MLPAGGECSLKHIQFERSPRFDAMVGAPVVGMVEGMNTVGDDAECGIIIIIVNRDNLPITKSSPILGVPSDITAGQAVTSRNASARPETLSESMSESHLSTARRPK